MRSTKNHLKYRHIKICSFLALAVVLFFCSNHAEAAGKKQPHTLINLADKELWNMNYPKADSLYSMVLLDNPDNADLYWKLARLQVSMGESNTDNSKEHYSKAAEYARKCVSLDSTNGKGHTWLAASLAIMVENRGTKAKLKQAKEIKRELDTAIRLNPNDETALSMLGSYYREAARIGWFKRMMANTFIGEVPVGNYELAEKAFRKAITLDPTIIRNYHELALICLDNNKREEAMSLMKTAIDKPILVASDIRRVEEMRKLIKRYSNE